MKDWTGSSAEHVLRPASPTYTDKFRKKMVEHTADVVEFLQGVAVVASMRERYIDAHLLR